VGFSKKVDIIHIPENSHVNTHATRTEYLTWPLLWHAKYFRITVHV
jgi:ethanolamine utilization protein EutQ (cupin superfamily)